MKQMIAGPTVPAQVELNAYESWKSAYFLFDQSG